ncbi:MAG: hypothetical protein ACXABY_13965 [Candidatus Thorarchaeota archaeon]|jgi:hypothetical protein
MAKIYSIEEYQRIGEELRNELGCDDCAVEGVSDKFVGIVVSYKGCPIVINYEVYSRGDIGVMAEIIHKEFSEPDAYFMGKVAGYRWGLTQAFCDCGCENLSRITDHPLFRDRKGLGAWEIKTAAENIEMSHMLRLMLREANGGMNEGDKEP